MALLAMAQYGRALCSLHASCTAADSEAAIQAALAARRVPVWLPWPMLRNAPDVPPSWDVTSDSLALWLATRLGATGVVLVKHATLRGAPDAGLVDAAFPQFRARFAGDVRIAGPDDLAHAAPTLASGRLPGLAPAARAA
jgi:dihydroneopterin aldolase